MRAFYDTSVLVAVFDGKHQDHAASLGRFASALRKDSACGAHTLAEVYAVLTRMPVKPPIRPEQAMMFIKEIQERLSVICLDEREYLHTLEEAASKVLPAGRIYDALIIECARKSKAERIYTLNLRDFQRIAPDLADRMTAP